VNPVGRERRWNRQSTEDIERDGRALRLYSQRLPYREIASQLGVSVGGAHKMVHRGMLRFLKDNGAEEVKADILARTDLALSAIMPAVEKGDPTAIDRMLKLDKQLRDLFGLDAPKTKRHEWIDANSLEAQIADAAARLGVPVPPRIIDTSAVPALNP